MRPECLLLATLWLLDCAGRSWALSTCKSLDLELVKRKRIEAIRGQILSKLRLSKEPVEEEEEEEEVPASLMSIYNSTVELSEEQGHALTTPTPDSDEEAYFAKEVHKFDMKQSEKEQLFFNISEMRSALGNDSLLSQAELRLLIKNPKMAPGTEQRLELYQGVGGASRYLDSRFVSAESANRWLSFDVTQTLRDWLEGTGEEHGFQLKLPCECEQPMQNFLFTISGTSTNNERGDKARLHMKMPKPHILLMSLPAERHSQLTSRRKRQTTPAEMCTDQSESCCVRSLYIDFRKDLGWKWIHEPTGYFANYCMGPCTYIWNTENKYSQVLALYKHHNPGASAQPCCVPQVLDALPILYYVGRQHKVEQLSSMIVKSCKCS